MNKNNNYELLEKHLTEINNLGNLLSIIKWDYATNIPKNSAKSRQEEITTLSSLKHRMFTSELTGSLIEKSKQESSILNDWQKSNIKLAEKFYVNAKCIDSKLQEKLTRYSNECEFIWRDAKKNSDFEAVTPYLEKLLQVVKEAGQLKAETLGIPVYDALLDTYAQGTTATSVTTTYDKLKGKLPKLIQDIIDKQKSDIISPLKEKISIDQQKNIAKRVMEIMQFDLSRGRLDESAHPFCGGTSNDIRLTTRYNEEDFITGLMGVIHETGHALYNQNLPKEYSTQFVGRPMGMTFHESQSLIMEMQVGRSHEFIEFLSKLLRDEFGFTSKEYESDNLYKLINKVSRSFIRVDADEVTYTMHVIMRFEIEKALIEGDLQIKDIPQIWNEKMQKYLGIKPSNNEQGCMQDIHWYAGMFGYFPSYTNGAIVSSMLMKSAKKVYPDLLNEIKDGNLSLVNNYLNEKFRNIGSLYNSSELLELSTGEDSLNSETFIKYLTDKYIS